MRKAKIFLLTTAIASVVICANANAEYCRWWMSTGSANSYAHYSQVHIPTYSCYTDSTRKEMISSDSYWVDVPYDQYRASISSDGTYTFTNKEDPSIVYTNNGNGNPAPVITTSTSTYEYKDGKQVQWNRVSKDPDGNVYYADKTGYVYDENGGSHVSSSSVYHSSTGQTTERKYTYDENWKQYKTYEATTYSNGRKTAYDYTYDESGKQYVARETVVKADGSSTSYDYTYDENGNRHITREAVVGVDGSGHVYAYSYGDDWTQYQTHNETISSSGTRSVSDYEYDAKGNLSGTTKYRPFTVSEASSATVKGGGNSVTINFR